MTIQEQIKDDLKQAMLNKEVEKKSLLRVIIGEFGREKTLKELPDDKVIGILKSMKDNALSLGNDTEVKLIDEYLPTMLSKEDLEPIIETYITDNNLRENENKGKTMGMIMGFLKKTYGATYDGGEASMIVKEKLDIK